MNKKEVIDAMSLKLAKSGLNKSEIKDVLESFVSVVEDAVARHEKVSLVGFGSWEVVDRSSRKGRNPSTGEEIIIPAKKAVKYKAGKSLKDLV